MDVKKRFLGLLGAGYWGRNILRNLVELGVLHTVCDADRDLLHMYREKYPGIGTTASIEELLSEESIRAVAIATPARTHYEFVRAALEAGKDVFVEKPLALTVTEGQELVERAERAGKVLMVGHILQYHPAVIRLQQLIRDGTLGKIEYIYSNRLNIGKLRTEENILWSFAPHDISLILSLLGEEPLAVTAFGGDYINTGVQDVTLTTLEFRNEVKAHIFVSWIHPFKEQKLVVVGSKAMAVFDDMSDEKLVVYPHTIEWKEGKIPVAQKADHYTLDIERQEPLKEELQHFVECVIERKIPRTDGHEGLKVLAVLEKAQRSLQRRTGLATGAAAAAGDYFVHETAHVDEDTVIGRGAKIWHFSHVLKGSRIGENCIIGQNVMVGPSVTIGDRCKIQNNVSVFKGITLEDEVFCGPSCVFTNVYNPRAFIERKHEFRPTLVKTGATIGANATIVCGNTIGRYAMIGAGAVVTSDVADYALVTGIPARQVGWVCKCGVTLQGIHGKETAACTDCGGMYRVKKGSLVAVEEAM